MRNKINIKLALPVVGFVILLVFPITVWAQGTLGDYQKAEQFLQRNIEKLVSKTEVIPNWIDKSTRFWYRNNLADGKEIKDFNFLIIPNRTHGLSDHRYFIRKRWDYFVKHLLGVEPPKEYKIADFDKDKPTT